MLIGCRSFYKHGMKQGPSRRIAWGKGSVRFGARTRLRPSRSEAFHEGSAALTLLAVVGGAVYLLFDPRTAATIGAWACGVACWIVAGYFVHPEPSLDHLVPEPRFPARRGPTMDAVAGFVFLLLLPARFISEALYALTFRTRLPTPEQLARGGWNADAVADLLR